MVSVRLRVLDDVFVFGSSCPAAAFEGDGLGNCCAEGASVAPRSYWRAWSGRNASLLRMARRRTRSSGSGFFGSGFFGGMAFFSSDAARVVCAWMSVRGVSADAPVVRLERLLSLVLVFVVLS